jgi:hypothetical protein
MFKITMRAGGIDPAVGLSAAEAIQNEFREHRPWHSSVACTFTAGTLTLVAFNDFDRDASALSDEFSDCLSAFVPPKSVNDMGVFEVVSIESEQPRDWRRPAGPYEAVAHARRRRRALLGESVATSSGFDVGRVLRRSFEIVRHRWLGLLLVTFVVGWASPHLIWLAAQANFRSWSATLTPLGLDGAVNVGERLMYQLCWATITVAALPVRDETPRAGIARVFRALPALVPIWLISDVDIAWDQLAGWTGVFRWSALPIETRMNIILAVSPVELLVVSVATVTVGVCYPVILGEGRRTLPALFRAWRLMRSARWRFLGLFVLYVVALAVITLPEVLITRAVAGVALTISQWATQAIRDAADALWCVVAVASYLELREVKEGPPHIQAAQVFA